MRSNSRFYFCSVAISLLLAQSGCATTSRGASGSAASTSAPVSPLFDLSSEYGSPFPSDRFTVADPDQNTGRRVNLPMPRDCTAEASECEDRALLNQLDGFNLQARISVPFTGDIDPASVTSDTVFLLGLGEPLAWREGFCTRDRVDRGQFRAPSNAPVGVNNIVWTPAAHELSFRPDVSLEQHTTYVLVVTTGVRDAAGIAIRAADRFGALAQDAAHAGDRYYGCALEIGESVARQASPRGVAVAAFSVFTTQSATHIVERMREAILAAPAPALDFDVGPDHSRAVFPFSRVASITHNIQTGANGTLTPTVLNAVNNLNVVPGAVETIAFATYRTLDFTTHPSAHVAPIPTRTGKLAPTGSVDVAVNVVLPAGTRPPAGWPVAILAHGGRANKNFVFPTAAVLNSRGIAVISINNMGHGGGLRTTTTVRFKDGTSTTYATPGLGYDGDGDGVIELFEPFVSPRPYGLFAETGPIVQTVSQYFALVRAIQAGIDVDGDGVRDLDPSRIYFFGHSMGGGYAFLVAAFEPAVRATVSCAPHGTHVYTLLVSSAYRGEVGQRLAARTPPLINSANALSSVDGQPVPGPFFNDNLPLRNLPPRINTVSGAIAIQRVLDREAWASQIGNPVAFAPMIRRSPAAGMSPRPFLIQIARSDRATTNPSQTELVRSGNLVDRVTLYRHDLNFGNEGVPPNSHLYLNSVSQAPNWARIGIGAQQQIATFFESDGATVIHPAPDEFWEVPIRGRLPEDTFFLPRPK